jgi:hypothetical protein
VILVRARRERSGADLFSVIAYATLAENPNAQASVRDAAAAAAVKIRARRR